MMQNKASHISRVDSRGFTLIEMMIAIAISGIVMVAIYGVFIASNESYRTQEGVADAQQKARAGLDFMVRNIRIAGLDPDPMNPATDATESSTGVGIKEATPIKIRFTADMDMNGTIDNGNNERLTYTHDAANSTLRQIRYEGTASADPQTMVDNVTALQFTYLDVNGLEITPPPGTTPTELDKIRSVIITITCQGTGKQGQILTRTLSTRVNCRNLGM